MTTSKNAMPYWAFSQHSDDVAQLIIHPREFNSVEDLDLYVSSLMAIRIFLPGKTGSASAADGVLHSSDAAG